MVNFTICNILSRLVRVEKNQYGDGKSKCGPTPYGLHPSTNEIKPTQTKPVMGWINLLYFLLGNLIINGRTYKVICVNYTFKNSNFKYRL